MGNGFRRKSLDEVLAGAPGKRGVRGPLVNEQPLSGPWHPKPLWAILGHEPPIGWALESATVPLAQTAHGRQEEANNAAGPPTATDTSGGGAQGRPETAEVPSGAVLYPDYFLPGGKLTWPTEYPLVRSTFGNRERDGRREFHNGVDIRAPRDSPIRAVDDGIVSDVYRNPKGGNQIRIQHPDGYVSGYAHTGAVVDPGQRVRRGQVIGHSDGSGGVVPHLHFTYRPGPDKARVDPYPFLPQVPVKP